MRVCENCKFPAMIAGDYGGTAPIPCAKCGGLLGKWMRRDSKEARAADKAWFSAMKPKRKTAPAKES